MNTEKYEGILNDQCDNCEHCERLRKQLARAWNELESNRLAAERIVHYAHPSWHEKRSNANAWLEVVESYIRKWENERELTIPQLTNSVRTFMYKLVMAAVADVAKGHPNMPVHQASMSIAKRLTGNLLKNSASLRKLVALMYDDQTAPPLPLPQEIFAELDGFLDSLQRSNADISAGRLHSHEAVMAELG